MMAMVDLAANSNGKPITLAEIASRQELSLPYLEQLFSSLRKVGIVRSIKGPGGGYVLVRSPHDTRISDVILAVDEPIQATRCSSKNAIGCRSNQQRCLTHDLWHELGNQIYLYLNSVSLANVVNHEVSGTSGLYGNPLIDHKVKIRN